MLFNIQCINFSSLATLYILSFVIDNFLIWVFFLMCGEILFELFYFTFSLLLLLLEHKFFSHTPRIHANTRPTDEQATTTTTRTMMMMTTTATTATTTTTNARNFFLYIYFLFHCHNSLGFSKNEHTNNKKKRDEIERTHAKTNTKNFSIAI